MDAEQSEQPVVCGACREARHPLELDADGICEDCLATWGGAAAVEIADARDERGTRSVQRVDMPAARWEENARALLKLALELAEELRSKCNDPLHEQQIKELRAIESEWAGSGHISVLDHTPKT